MCNCGKLHDAKLTNLRQKNSALRTENRKLKKQKKRVCDSRNRWKANHKEKSVTIKQLRRTISRKGKVKGYRYDLSIIALCIQLRILAGCSYRSIRAILEVFAFYVDLNTKDLPCANTVENWVSKMGLFCLQNSANRFKDNEVCLIIDESAKMGKEKTFLVLACDAEKQNKQALSYADMQVCHLEGKGSWTGKQISAVIGKLSQQLNIGYVISDKAMNMKCGIRLSGMAYVSDISHLLATCLQKTFEQRPAYKRFIRQISAYQAKSVNQDLTYLCPPKQRVKARFMNQVDIVKWAANMLMKFDYLSPPEQTFFKALKQHMGIISAMLPCLLVARELGKVFKTEGLSRSTLDKAINLLKAYPFIEPVFKRLLLSYLADYESFVRKMGNTGKYHACSDIIESMFGAYKEKMCSNKQTGLTILGLELATYSNTKKQFEQTLELALESISMTTIEKWKATYTSENQATRRTEFFKNCPKF